MKLGISENGCFDVSHAVETAVLMSVMQWKQSICGFDVNLQSFVLLVCLNPVPIDLSHQLQLLLSACTCKNENFHMFIKNTIIFAKFTL